MNKKEICEHVKHYLSEGRKDLDIFNTALKVGINDKTKLKDTKELKENVLIYKNLIFFRFLLGFSYETEYDLAIQNYTPPGYFEGKVKIASTLDPKNKSGRMVDMLFQSLGVGLPNSNESDKLLKTLRAKFPKDKNILRVLQIMIATKKYTLRVEWEGDVKTKRCLVFYFEK